MSWPSTKMPPRSHVVEPLQQREQRRLAAAGLADQPDALARLDPQAEIVEQPFAARIAERDVLQLDAGAEAEQRRGLRMVAQIVRHQQGRERFGQPRQMLRDVDQRHRKVARRVQHRQAERAGEHDVAGRDPALLPQQDRPGEQADGEHDRHHRMREAQPLEIQAGCAGARTARDRPCFRSGDARGACRRTRAPAAGCRSHRPSRRRPPRPCRRRRDAAACRRRRSETSRRPPRRRSPPASAPSARSRW